MADDNRPPMTFSQRIGVVPAGAVLQVRSIDDALRNGLWNILTAVLWNRLQTEHKISEYKNVGGIVTWIWTNHLRWPVDALKPYSSEVVGDLREYFFRCSWNEVYEFVEFVASDPDLRNWCVNFTERCNERLKQESSAYRFVGTKLTPIISEMEIESIEQASSQDDRFKPASTHISIALKHLADRTSPDYRNSIKESINAVEATCQILTGDDNATLQQAVKKLKDNGVKIHPAFEEALRKMYAYAGDAEGIRHALLEESTLDADDARFMLVSCSAFVNYLKAKSSKSSK